MARCRSLVISAAVLLLTGCAARHSALDPQGPQAAQLAALIWGFVILCSFVWLTVMAVLLAALLRRRAERPDPLARDPQRERRAWRIVTLAVGATAATVLTLTGISYVAQRAVSAHEPAAVRIKLVGHQWWWEVRYEDERPDRTFTTANEIYVPVGEPVTLTLNSTDVIHSFWVPSLAGKRDLIPGQDAELQFIAARPGVYRGQCAEYCGWQHAHMGIVVVAVERAAFDAWRERQIAPAAAPDDPERAKGLAVFLTKACVMCHAVRGTPAGGKVGPDLTHFASRSTIAAATLPMSRESIAGWIADTQGLKPGVHMPQVTLAADELEPLVAYLAGLQ